MENPSNRHLNAGAIKSRDSQIGLPRPRTHYFLNINIVFLKIQTLSIFENNPQSLLSLLVFFSCLTTRRHDRLVGCSFHEKHVFFGKRSQKKKSLIIFNFFFKIQTLSIFDFLVKIKTTPPSHSYLCLSSFLVLQPGGRTAWLAVQKNIFFSKRSQKKKSLIIFDFFL
jgi:hypothetical protein